MKFLQKLIDRIFKLEEINGGARCPTYMYRWALLHTKRLSVYVHHFVNDDWSLDMHDHPKRFISIGLKGRYIEWTPLITRRGFVVHSAPPVKRHFVAPWIRSFPAHHIHRLSLPQGHDCWTLVIVFKEQRPWGFWHDRKWMFWKDYVGSDAATAAKNCP